MKKTIIIFLIFVSTFCFGQNNNSEDIIYDSTVSILLSSGESFITKTQLDTGFIVKLSDPNSKLLSFSMIYFFSDGDQHGLQQISFEGNKAIIEKKFPKIGFFKNAKSNFITLEHVIIERNGILYRGKNLYLPIK